MADFHEACSVPASIGDVIESQHASGEETEDLDRYCRVGFTVERAHFAVMLGLPSPNTQWERSGFPSDAMKGSREVVNLMLTPSRR